jgi:hypothetical protein
MSSLQKWILGLLIVAVVAIFALLFLVSVIVLRPAAKGQPPTVVISAPAAGSSVAAGQPVDVKVEARDADVVRVELRVDGEAGGVQSSTNPAGQLSLSTSLPWVPNAPGPHVLVAWAYDSGGGVASSVPIAVLAVAPATPAPLETASPEATPSADAPTAVVESTATPSLSPEEALIAPLWDKLTKDWGDAKWADVVADLEQVVAIDPTYDDIRTKLYAAHVNFGNTLAAQGNNRVAIQEYQAALAVNPTGAEALLAMQRLQPTAVTVTPTITPNPAAPRPVVKVLAPAAGARVGVGQALDVNVVAASPANVARAELWADGGQAPVATLNNPVPNVQNWSFSFRWTSYVLGAHSLVVRAYDSRSNYGDSSYIPLTVIANGQRPQVWLTGPADGQRVQLGQTVVIEGAATDDVGVVRIETWVDGAVWQVDSSAGRSPLYASHRWMSDSIGTHTLKLRAIDTSNAVADSATITIRVEDTSGPVVLIEAPGNGSVVQKGAQVNVQSTAVDNNGIARLELYLDGRLIRTDGNPNPGARSWTVVQPFTADVAGSHILTTRAYNPGGQRDDSRQVVIDVRSGPTPTPTPDLSGYWYGPVLGSNEGLFLSLAQHSTTLDGTIWYDNVQTRMEGALDNSVVSGDQVNLHADFMLDGIGVTIQAQVRNNGQNLIGTYEFSDGQGGPVTFRRSGAPPPHPVSRPTSTPTPTMEPMPSPVYPTEEPTFAPMPSPIPPTEEPTIEPLPSPVYPTEEPTFAPMPTPIPPTEEPTLAPTEPPTEEPTIEPMPGPIEPMPGPVPPSDDSVFDLMHDW